MNVLLIHSDQHRYDCIASNGIRPDIQTPHLDRLCKTGTSFTRAYSTIPICTPARASLLTGAWPTTHGSFCIPTSEINHPARPNLPTILDCLKQAGYSTSWIGKYHRELDTWNPEENDNLDYFAPLWKYKKHLEAKGLPKEPAEHGLFGDENTETPPDHTQLAWQADRVIEQLDAQAENPFFIRWDPPEPHLPCRPASRFCEAYIAADIQPWQSYPDSLEGKPCAQKRQQKIWGLEDWTWENWQPIVRLYYGAITEMDHHIGRVLDKLEALGLRENTLVIYSTDHGDYCGGHSQMDKHFNMYDDVCRVPLILSQPGTIPQGAQCDAFASNEIDMARAILESAGIPIPDTFQGESLLTMATNADHRPRDAAFSQYFGTETGAYSCRMIRDERYKFVYHATGDMHEFYDLEEDPGELNNLIANAAHSEKINQLKAKLWDTMKSCEDRLANAWTAVELKGAPTYAANAF